MTVVQLPGSSKDAALDDHAWVAAAPFRAKLNDLIAQSGLPWRVVSIAIGVPSGVARSLLFGRAGGQVRRIRRVDADRILHASTEQLARLGRLPADPDQLKLAIALLTSRLSDADLSRALLLSAAGLRAVRSGRGWATQSTALRAQALCEQLGIDLQEWQQNLDQLPRAA